MSIFGTSMPLKILPIILIVDCDTCAFLYHVAQICLTIRSRNLQNLLKVTPSLGYFTIAKCRYQKTRNSLSQQNLYLYFQITFSNTQTTDMSATVCCCDLAFLSLFIFSFRRHGIMLGRSKPAALLTSSTTFK